MDALLVDPASVSRAPTRIRPDGEVLDPVLEARLRVAVDELMCALDGSVLRS